MSRVIKFRAWDGKEMQDYFEVTPEGTVSVWDSNRRASYEPFPEWILMQFTGLLDKNGEEIYEGDTVRWFVQLTHEIIIDVIEFDSGEFRTKDTGIRLRGFDTGNGTVLEVIGNLYQTPNL